jgi:hypothetical protein
LSNGEAKDAAREVAVRLHRGLSGEIGEPLPIHSPGGECAGWFVPSTSEGRLVGFHQLRPDLVPMRWSEFPSHVDLSVWTDPARVLEAAMMELGPGETSGQPVLSYDGNPDRVAWAVPVISPEQGVAIFVAGSAVWRGAWPAPPRT